MQSGLFGIPELGRGYATTPDYLHQCLSPIHANVARYHSKRRRKRDESVGRGALERSQGRGASSEDLGFTQARILVDALSTPELLQVLKKWHIMSPSGIPLTYNIPRSELLDLVVQHEEVLAEVVRLVTPRTGGRGVEPASKTTETPRVIQINCQRAASSGYDSILDLYGRTIKESEKLKRSAIERHREDARIGVFGVIQKDQEPLVGEASARRLSHDVGATARKQLGTSCQETRASRSKTKDVAFTERKKENAKGSADGNTTGSKEGTNSSQALKQSRRRYHELKNLLSETQRQREGFGVELARRGLLAVALDSDMGKPVMKGQNKEMTGVQRNMEATNSYHFNRMQKDLKGVFLDPIRIQQTDVASSLRTLCL